MTETKHKHALPKDVRPEPRPRVAASAPGRRARVRQPWFRSGRAGLVLVLVVAVLAGMAVAALTVGGSGDPAEASDPPGVVAAGRGISWVAEDGSAYRMTVRPAAAPIETASSTGCVPAPGPGATNLQFVVEVVNRTPTRAEVPELEFAVNLAGDGSVDPGPVAFAEASRQIEMTPVVGARSCADSAEVSPIGRVRIEPGGSVTFTGTIAGVREPVGAGLAVMIRYAKADTASATGSTTAVVRVPLTS